MKVLCGQSVNAVCCSEVCVKVTNPFPLFFFSLVIVEEASSRMLEKAKKDGLNNELHIEISKIKVAQLKFADDISYSSIQVESLKIILQAIV